MTRQDDEPAESATGAGLLTVLVGTGMVLLDVAAVYFLLATGGVPTPLVYAGTAVAGGVIGGAFLHVLLARRGSPAEPEPSALQRVARIVVSITVLSGVTVALGYGGGLLLWASATLGGPDPALADGDLLRDRLLDWPARNRAFMRTEGQAELPLRP